MNNEIIIYVRCLNCDDGNVTKDYKELESDKDSNMVLVDKQAKQMVSYNLTKDQLRNQTITQFVANMPCRKCRSKKLIEIVY